MEDIMNHKWMTNSNIADLSSVDWKLKQSRKNTMVKEFDARTTAEFSKKPVILKEEKVERGIECTDGMIVSSQESLTPNTPKDKPINVKKPIKETPKPEPSYWIEFDEIPEFVQVRHKKSNVAKKESKSTEEKRTAPKKIVHKKTCSANKFTSESESDSGFASKNPSNENWKNCCDCSSQENCNQQHDDNDFNIKFNQLKTADM